MSSDLMNRQLSDKLKPFSTLVFVVSCVSVIYGRPVIVCPNCGDNFRIPLRSDLGCVCLHRCASGTFGWIETPPAVAFGQTFLPLNSLVLGIPQNFIFGSPVAAPNFSSPGSAKCPARVSTCSPLLSAGHTCLCPRCRLSVLLIIIQN